MAKATKDNVQNEDIQANTSTKLKPGRGPEQPQQDTKVKAAKESKTASRDIPSTPRRSPKEEPVILVTNDDGVTAPGIAALVDAVKDL